MFGFSTDHFDMKKKTKKKKKKKKKNQNHTYKLLFIYYGRSKVMRENLIRTFFVYGTIIITMTSSKVMKMFAKVVCS